MTEKGRRHEAAPTEQPSQEKSRRHALRYAQGKKPPLQTDGVRTLRARGIPPCVRNDVDFLYALESQAHG